MGCSHGHLHQLTGWSRAHLWVEWKGWASSVVFRFFAHISLSKISLMGNPVRKTEKRGPSVWSKVCACVCVYVCVGMSSRTPERNSKMFHLKGLLEDLHSTIP